MQQPEEKSVRPIPEPGISARFLKGFMYIASLRDTGAIVRIAGNLTAVTGYHDEELLSGRLRTEDYICTEDLESYRTSQAAFISEGSGEWNFNYRIRHKTVGLIRVQETAIIQNDENGDPEFLIGNVQDVTVDYLNTISHRQLMAFREAIDRFLICTITEPDGTIVYTNRKFSIRSGYSIKEILGRTHKIVSSHHHDSKFWETLWSTIKSGKKWSGVVQNMSKSGEKYWEEKIVIPVVDTDGKILNYISLGNDVTQRLELEQKLLFFKEAIDVSPDMMFLVDAQTFRIIDCNRTAISATGYTYERISEVNLPYLLADVSDNELKYYLDEVLKIKNRRGVFEAKLKTADDKRIACEFVFVVYQSKKWSNRIIFSVRDITGKNELQRELESHRTNMSEIAKMAKMGTWEWKLKEDIIYLSANSANILGLGDKENTISFKDFQKMIHPADLHLMNKAVLNIMNNSEPEAYNYRIATSVGAEKHIMLKRYNIKYSADKKIDSVEGFAQDITEIRKTQMENEYYNEKVEQMVFQTSHHLRASVSTILGVLEVFRRGTAQEAETAMLLKYISDAANEADENLKIMFRRLQEAQQLRK